MYDVIGIDPGPVVGIARLRVGALTKRLGVEALQVTPGVLTAVLDALHQAAPDAPVVALERFVVGPRSSRSATPAGGAAARDVVALVEDWLRCSVVVGYHARSAADVKPWATDARLAAAGLLEPTTGMRHARDAARHALYAAVKTYGLPDPLSARAGKRCTGCGQTGEWTPSGCARCGPVQ